MKFCSKCGAPCGDDINQCPECGYVFPAEQTEPQNNQSNNTTNSNNGQDSNPYSHSWQQNTNTDTNANTNNTYGGPYQYQQYKAPAPNTPGIAERSIVAAIILSFVTCGIYQIYWMIMLNDEVNTLSGEQNATSGGMVFLFSLITCGIYGIYWAYKMGERCDRINKVNGNSHILYLVITLLGFGIVNYCLMQDTINRTVRIQQGR